MKPFDFRKPTNTTAADKQTGTVAAVSVVGVIFLFLFAKSFKFTRFGNNDSMYPAIAQHIFNPDYLAGDAFIGAFDYLLLFGYTVGPLVEAVGYKMSLLIGRAVLCLGFAVIFYHIAKLFRLNLLLTLVLCFLVLEHTSVGAGDYLISGVEAKTFAYIGILTFLLFYFHHRYVPAFACLGVAFSFHPLAVFACITFVLTYFSFRANWQPAKIKHHIVSSWAFWLTALPGLYSHGVHYLSALSLPPPLI